MAFGLLRDGGLGLRSQPIGVPQQTVKEGFGERTQAMVPPTLASLPYPTRLTLVTTRSPKCVGAASCARTVGHAPRRSSASSSYEFCCEGYPY